MAATWALPGIYGWQRFATPGFVSTLLGVSHRAGRTYTR